MSCSNTHFIIVALVAILLTPSLAFIMPPQQQPLPKSGNTNNHIFRLPLASESSNNSNIERIEYKIYPDGRVEQKVVGVKGGDCLKVTQEVNSALGEVISSEPTEEMFEQTLELDQTLTNTQSSNSGDSWEGASSW